MYIKNLDLKFQQRFTRNLISNVVYFILNIIIGLALVLFFLDTLGEAAYGLVPVATSITSYVTLVINCLNMSISRFLTIDLQRGDVDKANVTFNTAIFGTLAIAAILLPVAIIVAFACPYFLSIGSEAPLSVTLLFGMVFFSALVRAWGSNFMVTVFAHNRLDLHNLINCVNLLTQVGMVVLLFVVSTPTLPAVGLSYLVAAVTALLLSIWLSKRVNPNLVLRKADFNGLRFREMGVLSGWVLFQEIGTLLKLPIALIIVNVLFGEVAGTEYSLAMNFIALIIGIAALITNTFRPMIYNFVALHDFKGAAQFISSSMRITGLAMALPISLVCVFAPQLFTIWVGEQYAGLASLVWILVLIPAMLNSMGGCTGPLNIACNRVRATAIANFLAAILNIVLAFSIPFIWNNGMYGVAIAWVISMAVYCIFSFVYCAYIIAAPIFTFIKSSLPGLFSVALLFLICLMMSNVFNFANDAYLGMIVMCGIVSISYFLILSKIVLTKAEIAQIRACLPSFINKCLPR